MRGSVRPALLLLTLVAMLAASLGLAAPARGTMRAGTPTIVAARRARAGRVA
mgnify:CR=1 FL=1